VESVPSASVKACIAKEKEEGQEETYKCPGSKQQIPTGSQIHRSVNEKNVEEEENRVGLPMVCVCVCVCVCRSSDVYPNSVAWHVRCLG